MNSLEDAYINIANEEEALLEQVKQHGIQKYTSEVNADAP